VENKIIVALDFNSSSRAVEFVDNLDPKLCRLKIGKELFTAAGPNLVETMIKKEFDVFLDLKFHDIPNTVASAVKVAADLGVWMLNVHISGGSTMMKSAKDAILSHGGRQPTLIGVTVLTSISSAELSEIGINNDLKDQVVQLAKLAYQSGLDGVVCSAEEAKLLRNSMPADFILVTPGIRRKQDAAGDQKRVITPSQAIRNGSDYLVVGRPITQAVSPSAALSAFNSEIASV
tara:strand:- start:6050 stop:6748 length:699 start_codon:yes stop_codon:yes gene_type:complete